MIITCLRMKRSKLEVVTCAEFCAAVKKGDQHYTHVLNVKRVFTSIVSSLITFAQREEKPDKIIFNSLNVERGIQHCDLIKAFPVSPLHRNPSYHVSNLSYLSKQYTTVTYDVNVKHFTYHPNIISGILPDITTIPNDQQSAQVLSEVDVLLHMLWAAESNCLAAMYDAGTCEKLYMSHAIPHDIVVHTLCPICSTRNKLKN